MGPTAWDGSGDQYGQQVKGGARDPWQPTKPVGIDVSMDTSIENEDIAVNVRVTNITDQSIFGDIRIHIEPSNRLVEVANGEQKIEMLDPGQDRQLHFTLTPVRRPGLVNIHPLLTYFDFDEKGRRKHYLTHITLDFKTPRLVKNQQENVDFSEHPELDEEQWRVSLADFASIELESDIIEDAPEKVFQGLSQLLDQIKLFMYKPVIFEHIYRGIAHYTGQDTDGNHYALHLEVIGKDAQTKVLVIVYANDPWKCPGMAYGIRRRIKKKSPYGKKF